MYVGNGKEGQQAGSRDGVRGAGRQFRPLYGQQAVPGSFDAQATILREVGGQASVDAVLERTQASGFGASAVLGREGVDGFLARQILGLGVDDAPLVEPDVAPVNPVSHVEHTGLRAAA